MALEDTGLQLEVRKIVASGAKPVHSQWQSRILVGDEIVTPLKVLSIDVERLYDQQYSDRVFLEVAMGLGTYNRRVFPYRQSLEVVLTELPLSEIGDVELEVEPIRTYTYRGVLLEESSDSMQNNTQGLHNEETANLMDIKRVRFQLVDKALEQVRTIGVGGMYRREVPANVLRQILTRYSNQVEMDEDERILGVDMVAPDNTDIREHIEIPHGTPLVELPFLLQEEQGGIYSTGLGFYLQEGLWYVYPEYRTDRFGSTPKGLTVINVPPNRYPEMERTYRTTANQVVVLCTGEVIHRDGSDRLQDNLGNGVRFTDSRNVIESFSTTENNKTTVRRGKNNHEYVAFGKKTGIDFTPVIKESVSSNPFSQASKLARRKGATIQLKWENSQWGLLYPGMPVRFLYYQDNLVHEAEGVLLQAHHYIESNKPGLVMGRHVCNSALTIFVENDVEWEPPETTT